MLAEKVVVVPLLSGGRTLTPKKYPRSAVSISTGLLLVGSHWPLPELNPNTCPLLGAAVDTTRPRNPETWGLGYVPVRSPPAALDGGETPARYQASSVSPVCGIAPAVNVIVPAEMLKSRPAFCTSP